MIGDNTLDGELKSFLLSCRTEQLSPRTLEDYQLKIGVFLKFCHANNLVNPEDVTANHVRLFLIGLQEHCKPSTVADYYRTVKRFFNWMIGEERLPANPMVNIKKPKEPKTLITPFSTDDIFKMLLLCDEKRFTGIRNKAIILFTLDTGLRVSELVDVTIPDLDFDHETVKVMGKGAKERVVRMGIKTQKIVLHYLNFRKRTRPDDNCIYLFVSEERRKMTRWALNEMMESIRDRAGITGVRCSPHTLRHTFATLALVNEANLFELQRMLGHSSLEMTRRYTDSLKSDSAVQGHRGTKDRKGFGPVDNLKI
jgi:integrase/recombinase XerC/integrase/recombinase XerD